MQGLMGLGHLHIRQRLRTITGPGPLSKLVSLLAYTWDVLKCPAWAQAFGPWPEGMSERSYLGEQAKFGSQVGWGSIPACC